jgi:hypothetical protein
MAGDRVRAGALLACGVAGLVAASGCSSSSQPSWASALGSGVTVVAPAQVQPGHGSPGAAIAALFASISAKEYLAICDYVEPRLQASCRTAEGQADPGNQQTVKKAAIGYVAIHGDQALVGSTGTFCVPTETPKCFTNADPAAIFSGGKSFGALWAQADRATSQNVYMLAPCVKIGGRWYLHEPSS